MTILNVFSSALLFAVKGTCIEIVVRHCAYTPTGSHKLLLRTS